MGDRDVRLVAVEVGDEPSAWRAAGFAVEGTRLHAGGVTLSLTGAEGGRGLRSWSLEPAATGDCDGLPLAPAPPPGAGGARHPGRHDLPSAPEPPAHDNGVVALDHVVVTTDDVERTTGALAELGLAPRRTVTGARGDGDDEIRYRFFLLGTCVLELVGPTRPRGQGPARFAGLAFTTERLDDLGALAGEPRDAVQPGRRIATLRTRELGISVPTVLLSPRPEPDRRTAPRRARK